MDSQLNNSNYEKYKKYKNKGLSGLANVGNTCFINSCVKLFLIHMN